MPSDTLQNKTVPRRFFLSRVTVEAFFVGGRLTGRRHLVAQKRPKYTERRHGRVRNTERHSHHQKVYTRGEQLLLAVSNLF